MAEAKKPITKGKATTPKAAPKKANSDKAADKPTVKAKKNEKLSTMIGDLLNRADENIGHFLGELSASSKRAITKLHKEVTSKKVRKTGSSFTTITKKLNELAKEATDKQKELIADIKKDLKNLK